MSNKFIFYTKLVYWQV